jgi:hypothetical protein
MPLSATDQDRVAARKGVMMPLLRVSSNQKDYFLRPKQFEIRRSVSFAGRVANGFCLLRKGTVTRRSALLLLGESSILC